MLDESHFGKQPKNKWNLQPGKKVKGYVDFRSILARKDIRCITVLPRTIGMHIATLGNFQSGKDVTGETNCP